MGWETVSFKGKEFDYNNGLISWVQKFTELYLSKFEHPQWFYEFLDDIRSNFHIPHGKFFFDEELIDKETGRLDYALKMIDLTIEKMESMNKREFIEYIRNDLKGTWCDLEPYPDESWFNENVTYNNYIGVLKKLKEIMS